MGSISRPAAPPVSETPFDHLTDLITLITDPKAHAKRIAELKAATDAHASLVQQAVDLRKTAAAAHEAADVSAVYAGERHDDADKRESELRVKADQLAARESALVANEQALTAARTAWDRTCAETQNAHKLLDEAIAKHHAEATEARESAFDDRDDAARLKAEHTRLRDDASSLFARATAVLAAAMKG